MALKNILGSEKNTRFLWILALSGIFIAAMIFVFISLTMMPDTEELENPNYEQSTLVFSSDMEELGRYYKFNRDLITYEVLSPHLVDALVATEDERFHNHSGIDSRGLMRAIFFLGKRGGASTISQQLAKLFFTDKSSSIVRRIWQKFKEWSIAVQFEKRYTKEEIIAMYLNKSDFLYDSFGIGAASRTYFAKDQKDLTIEEAAVLIGMLKAPYYYNPVIHPDNALRRRNTVLRQMLKNRFISQEVFDELKEKPIDVSNFKKSVHYDGPAPYFRMELTKWLTSLLKKDPFRKPDGTTYDIYRDGLRIYTTLDYRMQKHAEEAMRWHMSTVQKNYFNVWKNRDPWTDKINEASLESRKRSLNGLVRSSDRYKSLRKKYLTDISAKIKTDFPKAKLRNIDILRMIREQKKSGHLASLVRDGFVSASQSARYKKIMKSADWKTLITQWNSLEKEAKKAFSKKRKMTVFAYTDNGEKQVTMSPMDSIKYHAQHLQLGSLAIDPKNGHVKAWVGGVGHKYFQYDHVTSERQVGSTFKPFIYTTAVLEQGISPCRRITDEQYAIPAGGGDFKLSKTWAPANSDNTFSGENLSLKEGLKLSKNSVSVWLMMQLGNVQAVKNIIERMGIEKDRIPNYPSICLGTPQLSVMEMAGAYTTYANDGIYTKPIFVTKIEDKDGRVIYTGTPFQQRALRPDYNYAMVDMLRYATNHHSWQLQSEFGGKTGTTDDFVDGWFMGITPELVVGTWVGGEKNWFRFLNIGLGQGGVMARPFFFDFMKRVESDKNLDYDPSARFALPESMSIELDCSKYDSLYYNKTTLPQSDSEDTEFDDEFDEELDDD